MVTALQTLVDALLEELAAALRGVDDEAVDALRRKLVEAHRVFVAGRGRSGLQMRAFAMRLMHLGRTVYVVDDVTTPGIRRGDLLLIGSGSGRTASLVHYATRACEEGAQVALITAARDSPIAQQAGCVVQIPAPTPKLADSGTGRSVQPMGTLFEQALGLLLDLLILQLMGDLDASAEQMFARHANLE